jgi:hypothetical protein
MYYKDRVTKIILNWHKKPHKDQWNRTENPETNPHIYTQLIFDKVMENGE